MSAAVQYTKAEEALFAAFDAQKGELAGDVAARERAISTLKEKGFPTRRVEAWHYTDLRSKLQKVAEPAASTDEAPAKPLVAVEQSVEAKGFNASRFSADNTSFGFHGDDDAVGQINAAFANSGMRCSIDAGASFEVPLEFVTQVNGGAKHTRHVIEVANDAKVTFVERQMGAGGFGTAVTMLNVQEGAQVTYVIVQQTSLASSHLAQFNARIGKNAQLNLFILNAGGELVRQEVRVDVAGEESDFQLRCVNLIGDGQHIDVTMDLKHSVANTTSEEVIRNIVAGNGHGIFQGKIAVAQIAQKTDAKMSCNTLLLTDEGDFSTKPELEIFADDVACGHGATFTDIEPSHMFYLKSRGIPEREARALLIKAFVDEIAEELEDDRLQDAIINIIDEWLGSNI